MREVAVRKIEASSLTDNAKIQQQNQQKIDSELTSSSSSTIQRAEVEVIVNRRTISNSIHLYQLKIYQH